MQTAAANARPAAFGRRARSCAASAIAICGLMFASMPLGAQTTAQDYDRNTPYGSPLSNSATQGLTTDQAQAAPTSTSSSSTTTSGTIQPVDINRSSDDADESGQGSSRNTQRTRAGDDRNATTVTREEATKRLAAPPSEFERFTEAQLGRKLPRYGANLLVPGSRDFAVPATATVPPAYILQPGDQLSIGLTGSIEGTLDGEIDTDGRIFVPRVGSVRLAGVRYGDAQATLSRAIGRQFRDFRVAVNVARLRGIRVYVTGFANNPGAYTVSSLSTMANAVLAAGGPAAGGSYRSVKLYRNGALVSDFDLYDLIRNGDRSKDAVLQNEDVLRIAPVGQQIAIAGSVNDEAIYEAKPGESIQQLLGYAGGTNALADSSRVMLYRISNLDNGGGQEVPRAQLPTVVAEGGDIVRVLSVGTLVRPLERQSVLVRVEGEVAQPGNYLVQPGATVAQIVTLAGGLTARAFVYGTRFERTSVREQQRAGFQEAVRQLELSLAAAPLTADSALDAGSRDAQLLAARGVLTQLRRTEPDGRLVLNLTPASTALPPDFTLENNDRIFVPPRAETVGVFGAVYRPASFSLSGGDPRRVRDFVQRAGGPLRAADRSQIFVVRANGSVLSHHNGAMSAAVLPGDVIFVPIKTQSVSVWTKLLQISSLVFQLGLSTAAFIAVAK